MLAADRRQHLGERGAQEEKYAVAEQQDNRRPARDERFVASAPEFVGAHPTERRDDEAARQDAEVVGLDERGELPGDHPHDGACRERAGQRLAPVEDPRPGPGEAVGREQQRPGKIDRNDVRGRAVKAVKSDRETAHEMGGAPPGDCPCAQVLRPRQQQQQAENGLHIHREEEQRLDVKHHEAQETHDDLPLGLQPNPGFRN